MVRTLRLAILSLCAYLSLVSAAGGGGGGGSSGGGSKGGSSSGASSGSGSGSRSGSRPGSNGNPSTNGDPDPDPDPSPGDPPDTGAAASSCTSSPCPSSTSAYQQAEDPMEDIGQQIQGFLNAITLANPASSATSSLATITSATPLPTDAYPCLSASSFYASCSAATPDFGAVPLTGQASCLCYMSTQLGDITTWTPSPFDSFMSSCDGFVKAQTQITGVASNIERAVGLCTSAGDTTSSNGALAEPTNTATGRTTLSNNLDAATADASNTLSDSQFNGSRRHCVSLQSLPLLVAVLFGSFVM